ncbi:condensation domain-containing protein, partial [Nocardiopsis sp. CNT312]|uniref:condensation domain-containing protein n=1 Tax=Nocardiopsis sp. CNT312 TaxID=1137268 RepID=UPI00048E8D4C
MPSSEPTLEDVLPLTPLQEGLLFHAHSDRRDVYTVRTGVDLSGPLDHERLRAALGTVLRRYPNLRVGFWYEDMSRPVQFVAADVTVPFRTVDLSKTAPERVGEEVERIGREEDATPFDLTDAPPLRCVLVRRGEDEHTLLLTNHHIILDGWSTPLLIGELLAAYAADGGDLPPAPAFRDHLAWLASQDTDAARRAWAEALDGAPAATALLGEGAGRDGDPATGRVGLDLTEQEARELTAAPARTGATVNALIQAAWALVASRRTGQDDVVFGATVSGRSTGLPGVESMIGLFINTVPVHARLRPAESGADLALRIQEEQGRLIEHQHLGLGRIQRASGTEAAFDSLLVVENYPIDPALFQRSFAGVGISGVDVRDATHYPLTLVALPGGEPRFVLGHRTDLCDREGALALLGEFRDTLMRLVRDPGEPVARVSVHCGDAGVTGAVNDTAVVVSGGVLGGSPGGAGRWSGRVALVD